MAGARRYDFQIRRDQIASFVNDPRTIRDIEALQRAVTQTTPQDIAELDEAKVDKTRRIDTDGTLTGGDDLSADLTLGINITAETERVQDLVGAALTDTATIDFTYNDGAGTITADVKAGSIGPTQLADTAVTPGSYTLASITVDADGRLTAASSGSAAPSYTDEQAQDAIGSILTDTGLAIVTYSDATPSIDVNVPAAAASDINTGTDTTKALTADALAGSNMGKAVITILVSDPNGSAITTGDGKAYYRVPSTMNGMNLVAVAAAVTTVSSSGIPTVQIANVTDSVDMLSTKLTIDASETDSSTAAAAAVIDTTKDDVATGDMLRIDIDVAGTGAKGLQVEMQFQLP